MTDANPQLSGSQTAQHHTPIMEISHKWGWGGCCLSLSLSRAHHVSMATALTGTTTGSSCYQRFKRKCMWSFQCRDVTQSWSLCSVCLWFMVLRLKFPVAALQSKVNFKHVLSQTQSCRGRRGKIGEGRGGKAPQETNPSSVGGRDANPQ